MKEICVKKSCGFRTDAGNNAAGDQVAFCVLPKCPYAKSYKVDLQKKQNETRKGVK